MQVLKLYDPSRRPANWTDLLTSGQFAALSKDLDLGVACDHEGRAFADVRATTCVVFDSLDEARRFCEGRVLERPSLQFDVFDSEGRAHPPLITIVSPARAESLDDSPRIRRRRTRIAYALIAAAIVLFAVQYWGDTEGVFVLPMFLGINLLVAAARLLLMNVGARDADRERNRRLRLYK